MSMPGQQCGIWIPDSVRLHTLVTGGGCGDGGVSGCTRLGFWVQGWGTSVIIGVAGKGKEISTRPFQLVTGQGGCCLYCLLNNFLK